MSLHAPGAPRYERAFQLMNWRRFDEAIRETEHWILEDPENADAYGLLAQIHMKAGRYDRAMNYSAEALRYDPENAMAWFVRTMTLYSQGKEELFLEAAEEAQRLDPLESYYPFLKFNLAHKKGNFKTAREEMDHALRLAPDRSLYLAADSYLRANMRDFEGSLSSESMALFYDPEDDQTFLYLAWAADRRGDYGKEIEFMKNAVRIDPADAQIRSEYLNSLQKKYWFYRVLLMPFIVRKRLGRWQFFLIWVVLWLVFRPLVLLFLLLYVLAYWLSKLLVKVQVFGWKSLFRKIS
ncbi:tetratricopeptide (TPR) repeat protein [Paenibacillus forsythiae]|uniref:Tetratricopeptide (TPR) repeat protein n=1 Tax=Paenibacillus forsythiae TaxID=365616 RepID=A0ABU3H3K9_9BACL|nr:tetratricopeptide repeat protein [Paenibacillus forsythiae]MDT3425404.1 tetratricopeptide (TPR) repeat protein [Paenibacillus forsythiae]